MEPKSLFEWHDVLFEYVGFLASFWILGPVGFRCAVLRSGVSPRRSGESGLAEVLAGCSARAAGIGVLGAGLGVVSFVESLLKRAEAKHLTLGAALDAGGAAALVQVALLALLLVAFSLAWRRISLGWPIAGIAAIAFALRNLLGGRLQGMVNPLHVLGASMWLGTLFVLVVCGIQGVLVSSVSPAEREQVVAEMVRRFSTVGLASAALLGATGLITGWTHLKPFAALWSTPYGYALIGKLCVVGAVAGLGAWNWRRVGPSLGTDGGTLAIRRSAATELAFAAVVLLITAILVSLPSPKLPGH